MLQCSGHRGLHKLCTLQQMCKSNCDRTFSPGGCVAECQYRYTMMRNMGMPAGDAMASIYTNNTPSTLNFNLF